MHPVYLDGQWGTTEDMKVSVLDRGFLFGDGVYEVYRLYGKSAFARDQHLARLDRSLRGLELSLPCPRDEFHAVLDEMERRSPPDAYVYIHVTRGVAPRRHSLPGVARPTLMAMAVELGTPPADLYRKGIGLRSMPDERWLRCSVKSLNLLGNCLAMTAANRQGAFEALLVGSDGLVNESAASSFFAVGNGVLWTAPLTRNILPGVTRALLLDLARAEGIPCAEEAVTLEEARAADEALITNAVYEILPVATIDGAQVGTGSVPGPVTKRLIELHDGEVRRLTGQQAVSARAVGILRDGSR
jgi:D-alanine transaminase